MPFLCHSSAPGLYWSLPGKGDEPASFYLYHSFVIVLYSICFGVLYSFFRVYNVYMWDTFSWFALAPFYDSRIYDNLLQIGVLKKELESVRKHRKQYRNRRVSVPVPVVSLVWNLSSIEYL